jgi:ribosomal protein S18 acetylase RimI-like enzyme
MAHIESKEGMNIKITAATPEDIIGVVQVRKEGWLSTYPNEALGITKEDILSEDFDSQERIKGWQGTLSNPDVLDLVAKDGDRVVGFVIAMKGQEINKIRGLYVLSSYQGKGIGKALTDQALAWLGNGKDVSLNVATYNENAIGFYERHGFVKGTKVVAKPHELLNSGKEIPEIEMIKKAQK